MCGICALFSNNRHIAAYGGRLGEGATIEIASIYLDEDEDTARAEYADQCTRGGWDAAYIAI